jgi:hypothetical protein
MAAEDWESLVAQNLCQLYVMASDEKGFNDISCLMGSSYSFLKPLKGHSGPPFPGADK